MNCFTQLNRRLFSLLVGSAVVFLSLQLSGCQPAPSQPLSSATASITKSSSDQSPTASPSSVPGQIPIAVEDISQESPAPVELTPAEPTFVAAVVDYKVLNRYPHDTKAFTQGLLVSPEGEFYESTGLQGHSEVRRVEIKTGKVLQSRKLSDVMFGEGMALLGDELIQLTWKNHKFLAYDRKSFQPTRDSELVGEGWGITSASVDGKAQLIVSDGSSSLAWYDPKSLKVIQRKTVRDGSQEVGHINELEMVEGNLWANIWGLSYVAVIDPGSAKVKYWVDLRGLLSPEEASSADVLNGIAFDPKSKKLYVTGKLWPKLFEIEVDAP